MTSPAAHNPDLMLISCPSKVIDYPSLSLPALTGFLRQNGINVTQRDLSMEIKDFLINEENLKQLLTDILPVLIRLNNSSAGSISNLGQFHALLRSIDKRWGFARVEGLKQQCQKRDYGFMNDKSQVDLLQSIFLISKSCDYFFSFIHIYLPLLRKHQIPFFLLDYLDQVFSEIMIERPLTLGFTAITTQNNFTLWFADNLKREYNYDGYIILGGSQATKFEEQYLLDNPAIDFLISGEGEFPLLKLVAELKKPQPRYQEIPRLTYRNGNGIVKTGNQKFLKDGYKSTFPDYDGYPLDKYLSPAFPILASNSCPWKKCKFCAHRTSFLEDYHPRNAINVVDEMGFMYQKYGTQLFHFADETIKAEQGSKIARLITERKLPLLWMSFGRLDDEFNEENLNQWYRGGARVVEWGLESASDNMLTKMNKGITSRKAQEIIQVAGRLGIKNKLLTWHNYPGESLEDLSRTISFVKKNVKEGLAAPMLTLRQKLVLQVGSELYNDIFNRNDPEKLFEKVWKPAAVYSINASYHISKGSSQAKEALIFPYLSEMEQYCNENDIFIASNENVTFDLIIFQLKEGGNRK